MAFTFPRLSWSPCRVLSPPRRSRVVVLSSSLIGLCTSVYKCSQLSVEATPDGFPVVPSDGSPAGSSVVPVSSGSAVSTFSRYTSV